MHGIYYLLVFVVIGACETKEAPTATGSCSKMDQTGKICLDGAQTSAPATATGSGGMTNEQMMNLMNTLQQNQQQRFSGVSSGTTMDQAVDNEETKLRNDKLRLEQENIRLKNENKTADLATMSANNSKIAQNNVEIKFIEDRLNKIAEARKQPGVVEQMKNATVGACTSNIGQCADKVKQVVGWLWENRPWGGDDDDGVASIPGG